METRFSGKRGLVRLVYREDHGAYRAIVFDGRRQHAVWVNPPRLLERSPEDPVSYDEAASAAIKFALPRGLKAESFRRAEAGTTAANEWVIERSR